MKERPHFKRHELRPSLKALKEAERLKQAGLHLSAAAAEVRFQRLAKHEAVEGALYKRELEARLARGERELDGLEEGGSFDRYRCRGCEFCTMGMF